MSPAENLPDPDSLTDRQRAVLDCIRRSVSDKGYPPSVREIGEAVGLKSPSSVHAQMNSLERMGFIRRDATRPRAIGVAAVDEEPLAPTTPTRPVPLLGEIAAGGPILAEQHVDEHYALPESLVGSGTIFALRVRGDSMIEAGVLDGDLVVIRQQASVEQGEMCAALIEGEATVKFFRRTKGGQVFLDPANEHYDPIPVPPDAQSAIMGKVVTVMRRL